MIALLAGVALAADIGFDALAGAPLTRSEPYSVTETTPTNPWGVWQVPDGGPWTGEARGHLDVGPVGFGMARAGLGLRGWSARYDREPSTLAPRELTAELTIGLHKVAGARGHVRRRVDPGVRAFFTTDLGPALHTGWMRPWGADTVVGLPVSGGFGVDVGRGEWAVRTHLRAWFDPIWGGRGGSAQSVGGDYSWRWDTGGAGLSLLIGAVRRGARSYPALPEQRFWERLFGGSSGRAALPNTEPPPGT